MRTALRAQTATRRGGTEVKFGTQELKNVETAVFFPAFLPSKFILRVLAVGLAQPMKP